MRFDVEFLFPQGCEVVGSRRKNKEYVEAVEALAVEVYHAAPTGLRYFRPHVGITAFVGKAPGVPVTGWWTSRRFYRPQCAHSMWPALDGVFEGMIRAGLIDSVASIPLISTAVTRVDTDEWEGLMIVLTELEGEAGQ